MGRGPSCCGVLARMPAVAVTVALVDLRERLLTRLEVGVCWEWQGCRAPSGHGMVSGKTYGRTRAHVAIYELLVGLVPEGLVLDHLCRNPPCCNPDHLEPVTPGENTRRGYGFGGRGRMTACSRGHEFNEANTYRRANGTRKCRVCAREDARKERAAA